MYKFVMLMAFLSSQPLLAAEVDQCKKVTDDTKRLACYDEIHGYKDALESIEESDVKLTRKPFAILPHKQTYFMPISFNDKRASLNDVVGPVTDDELNDLEVKFQISFKMPLWREILGENTELVAGYTQKSYWQMYNSDISSPFRETNYEPELYINKLTDIDILGMNLRSSSLGFVHQSNGRSGQLSRSWNRIYTHFVLQKDNFVISVKPWWRVSESAEEDDNPDIEDYLGNYELGMLYQYNDNEFTLMLRNINGSKHHETYQLGWLFPLGDDVNFYIEYFHGYGESLIDYNNQSETISMGFSITDWVD